MTIAHTTLQHLQLMAIRAQQLVIPVLADKAAANQINEDLPSPWAEIGQDCFTTLLSEEVFKTSTIQCPMGLGLQQRIRA
jgi:hypothetical protein